MASFNKVILIGNLTANPELKYTSGGLAVTSFTIAVNERIPSKKDGAAREEVGFFDVSVFGKTAENCANYLSKGRPVLVEGRLRQEKWEKDGVKRSKVTIVANTVQFLGGKGGSDTRSEAAPDDDLSIMDELPAETDIPF